MKRLRAVYFLCIILIFTSIFSLPVYANEKADTAKVLILHSYSHGFEWTDSVQEGINQAFEKENIEAEFLIEYMDTKVHAPETVFPLLRELYRSKYAGVDFDVILTSDNNALDFVLANREELFAGVPVVFCGENYFEESLLAGHEQVTGVVEDVDIEGTIALALKLHPGTKYIASISDVTPTDEANRRRLEEIKPKFTNRVKFIDFVGLGEDELPEALSQLSEHTIILFFDLYRDSHGKVYTLDEGIELVLGNTKLPVYTFWEDKVKKGLLGGVTVSGQIQGEKATEMAIEILRGTAASEIEILEESPNVAIFNYEGLKRHKISQSQLPVDFILLGEPETFFYRYRNTLLGITLLVCVQMLIILYLWINVIQRKRAQIELEDAKYKQNEAIKGGRVGLWNWDLQTNKVEYSDEWKEQIGYEDHEIGNSYEEWRSRVHPDDLPGTLERVQDCIREIQQDYSVEFRFRHKDGSYRWIRAQASVLQDDNGTPVRMLGSHIDITEEKQIQEQLRINEEKYRAMYENAPLAYQSLDEQGNVLDVNPMWLKTLGYARNEVIGRNFSEFLHPDTVSNFHKNFPILKQKGLVSNIEHKMKHKDGHFVDVSFEARIGYHPDGRFRQTYCVFKDITEEKRYQQQLEESEKRFKDIVNSLPQLVSYTDKDLCYRFVNRTYQEKFGLTEEEMVGRKISEILGESVFERGLPYIREALEGKYVTFHEHNDYSLGGLQDIDATLIPVFSEDGSPNGYYAVMTDVTPYVTMQQQLAESEAMYRALVQGLPDIVMRFDRDGRHLFVSENVSDVVDMKAEQFLGKTHRELGFPEEMCTFWEEAIRKVYDSGEMYETEFTYQGIDNQIFILNWRLVAERDAEGRIQSVLSISKDITEYRRAQQNYEILFREMIDGFALHEIICDENGMPVDYRFLAVNPAFERLTGLKKEDLIGKRILEILPGTEKSWIEKYGHVALTGEAISFEDYSRELDKYYTVTAFGPSQGQFACIFEDITDRKKAEEALAQSEHQKNLLLNSMSEMMAYHDTDLRILWANKASGDSVERSSDELIGMHCYEIWHCREQPCEDCPVLRAKESGKPEQSEIQTPDGRWWLLRGYPVLDGEGNVEALVEFGQDITERKQAEQEREKLLAQLMYKNKELQSMVYVTTHDLRTPLVNIVGFSRELIRDCTELRDFFRKLELEKGQQQQIEKIVEDRIPESLGFITSGTEKMLQQLNGLLRVSRVGSVAVNTERLDMNQVIGQVIGTFQYKAKELGIEVACEDLPDCMGDFALVNQVFSNLVDNAMKYNDPSRAGRIRLSGKLEEEYAVYCVEDNGIGIAKEYQEKIFEVFHRLNPKDSAGGEGLGLTIVIRALDRMNGHLRMESEVGTGSRFYVLLPKA